MKTSRILRSFGTDVPIHAADPNPKMQARIPISELDIVHIGQQINPGRQRFWNDLVTGTGQPGEEQPVVRIDAIVTSAVPRVRSALRLSGMTLRNDNVRSVPAKRALGPGCTRPRLRYQRPQGRVDRTDLVCDPSYRGLGQQALLSQARDTMAANQVGPVDDTLRSLVAQAWPGAAGRCSFAGTAHVLSFRTMMPESLTATRTRDADVTIGVDPEHRLYLTWLPYYRNWIVAKPPAARIDLLANVDHVEFAYRDPALHLPPGHWATGWTGTTVPKLLRIRLVFTKDAGLHWPDIIVATARDPWSVLMLTFL